MFIIIMFFSSGYIAMFIVPSTWSFYLTSVLIGIGAASKSLSPKLSLELQAWLLNVFEYMLAIACRLYTK